MLTGGHIAISYLLAETPRLFGLTLINKEIISIIIAGNIVDLDFLIGLANGKTGEAHHQNLTHTPFGILLLYFGWYLLFKPSFPLSILIIASMFLHLVLDEIGFWTYKLGFIKTKVNPQINWFYPFKSFPKIKMMTNNNEVLKFYLLKAWPIVLTELILIITSLFVFFILQIN